MDLVLDICDTLFLDAFWAKAVPLNAFPLQLNNGSSLRPLISDSGSKWIQLVSHLPHPPLVAPEALYSSLSNATTPTVSAWPRNYIPRQLLSLTVITLVGIHLLYFIFATLSYYFIFNHEMMKHPKFLKNQVRLEIMTSLRAFPAIMMLTLPVFQAEVMGYSKLYDRVDTYGWWYLVASVPCFLLFTDYCIYWIHRWLHIPIFYKLLHKPHHKWIIPTPFSSHAFHFIDGYLQSVPYHLYVFLFPLHRILYLGLFVFVNFWSILIHDSDMVTGHPLEKIINGPAHHTLHHIYFTVNYGQYFTWADRAGNSYRQPDSALDPMLEIQQAKKEQ
ncbi:fatty acid hydroxylase [Mycena floridula]|nr:fatty acid hydroxylase [Mycena floridula]